MRKGLQKSQPHPVRFEPVLVRYVYLKSEARFTLILIESRLDM